MGLGQQISVAILWMTLGLGVLAPATGAAQDASTEPSRIPDLKPDLSPDLNGVWDFRTLTPLQRPERLGNKAVYSREEAATIRARASERAERLAQPSRPDREAPPAGQSVGAYNYFWMDHSDGVVEDLRTSLIVDPPNGRLPPLVEGAERQVLGEAVPSHGYVRLRVRGLGTEDPDHQVLTAPPLIDLSGSGTNSSGSGISRDPSPWHSGQAPRWLLKEKCRGVSSGRLKPVSGLV